MISAHSLLRTIKSFRLGYNPWSQRRFLVCINTYEFVQEVTYRPNDTTSALLLGGWLPSLLQVPAVSFTPQILTVGDTIRLNGSSLDFIIASAFDLRDETVPVSTFSYSNNPFSDGCDVISAAILCYSPTTRFTLNWNATLSSDVMLAPANPGQKTISGMTLELLGERAVSVAVGWAYLPELKGFLVQDNSTIFFPNVRALPGLDNSTVVSAQAGTSNLVHNMFQSLFQVLRLEMGIILPNQIYASPEMFNNSILPVSLPPQFSIPNTISMANTSRASTTNASELSQWRDMVDLFNTTDRVPVMEYTRTVPKLKPLGSAITSVFVSTFAMLSSLWTVFSLAAGALARIYADHDIKRKEQEYDKSVVDLEKQQFRDRTGSFDERLEFADTEMSDFKTEMYYFKCLEYVEAEMSTSLRRMELALKRRGFIEELDEGGLNV
ncbi:hypothetical protein B0H14DRAFT_2570276 [Mycena olivaceomarginata]|nr:hypothetical protein B0H14DRAFT_2570276 [Mycena olivaceomarginata]